MPWNFRKPWIQRCQEWRTTILPFCIPMFKWCRFFIASGSGWSTSTESFSRANSTWRSTNSVGSLSTVTETYPHDFNIAKTWKPWKPHVRLGFQKSCKDDQTPNNLALIAKHGKKKMLTGHSTHSPWTLLVSRRRRGLQGLQTCCGASVKTETVWPEKGGRKPAPSRNLFGSAKKCRGSTRFCLAFLHFCYFQQQEVFLKHIIYIYLYDTPCLHVPFFSHLSFLCNPSPPLPRHHSSSPCKLSCSEPQQTLLSVEFQILSFFLASMS